MAYVEGRTIHDADSHIVETPEMLAPFATEPVERERMPGSPAVRPGDQAQRQVARTRPHADPHIERSTETEISCGRTGRDRRVLQGRPPERARPARLRDPARLQHLSSTDTCAGSSTERRPDLAYGTRRRTQSRDTSFLRRRPPPARRPLRPAGRFRQVPRRAQAIATGASALLVASACPRRHSPSHTGLFPLWASRRRSRRTDPVSCRPWLRAPRSRVFRERPAGTAGFPRRRGKFPLGGLHGDPRAGRANAGDADLHGVFERHPS